MNKNNIAQKSHLFFIQYNERNNDLTDKVNNQKTIFILITDSDRKPGGIVYRINKKTIFYKIQK